MVDITETAAIIAAAGVLVGVVIAVVELRNLVKTRQTDLIMRLHSQTLSAEFMEAYLKAMNLKFNDYNDFVRKYGPLTAEGPEQTAILMSGMFMEGIGVLLHKKLVDVETIRELFPVERVWRKLEPIVMGIRKERGDPESYEWFENLFNEMKKREQQLTSKTA